MIVQVRSDARQVRDLCDAECAKSIDVADAGSLQDGRRRVDATAEHDRAASKLDLFAIADGVDAGAIGIRLDAVDEHLVDDPQVRLATIRDLTTKAMNGEPTGTPAFDALAVVAAECGLTQSMADAVIDGFALDTAEWHPRSEGDLYRYCYHVAGAVGVMMAQIMGVAPQERETLDRACDLGLAFQLANISRDIEEDDAAGRCYVPDDWQALLDIGPGEMMRPHNRRKLALIARWMADEAGQYEASARVGASRLPFRARWAVSVSYTHLTLPTICSV